MADWITTEIEWTAFVWMTASYGLGVVKIARHIGRGLPSRPQRVPSRFDFWYAIAILTLACFSTLVASMKASLSYLWLAVSLFSAFLIVLAIVGHYGFEPLPPRNSQKNEMSAWWHAGFATFKLMMIGLWVYSWRHLFG